MPLGLGSLVTYLSHAIALQMDSMKFYIWFAVFTVCVISYICLLLLRR